MQIACSSRSLNREIPEQLALVDFPAWAGSQGIPLIEIEASQLPSLEPAYLDTLLRACRHANVQIACLALENDFTLPDADALFQQVERVRRMLYDVAKPLQAPVVRVFLGMADTSKMGDERALETFRSLVPDLEATGITMALENHSRRQTSSDRVAAIIAGVPTPLFGACLDLGSLPADLRAMAWNDLAPLSKYVHARTAVFGLDGDEVNIDYKMAFATLTEHGYDGIISIIYEGLADQYRGIRDTKALIEKYWYHPGAGRRRRAA